MGTSGSGKTDTSSTQPKCVESLVAGNVAQIANIIQSAQAELPELTVSQPGFSKKPKVGRLSLVLCHWAPQRRVNSWD